MRKERIVRERERCEGGGRKRSCETYVGREPGSGSGLAAKKEKEEDGKEIRSRRKRGDPDASNSELIELELTAQADETTTPVPSLLRTVSRVLQAPLTVVLLGRIDAKRVSLRVREDRAAQKKMRGNDEDEPVREEITIVGI